MKVDGYSARLEYNEIQDSYRGVILGLNGSTDFYGRTNRQLKRAFKRSLDDFMQFCQERSIDPHEKCTGDISLWIPIWLHERLVMHAREERVPVEALMMKYLANMLAASYPEKNYSTIEFC